MLENYLIVHKSILPDFFDNILEAKHLLEEGKAKNVMSEGRKAVISMLLSHETGILSHVLTKVSDAGASILTITQSLPVHGKASVTITLDISGMPSLVTGLLKDMDECQGVENTKLIAID